MKLKCFSRPWVRKDILVPVSEYSHRDKSGPICLICTDFQHGGFRVTGKPQWFPKDSLSRMEEVEVKKSKIEAAITDRVLELKSEIYVLENSLEGVKSEKDS